MKRNQPPIDQIPKGTSHEPRATSNELPHQPPATSHIIPERSERYQLFWTSGWDSTFRLLQLVLGQRVPVQPIYLIDPDHRSMPIEIRSMRAIKQALIQAHPHTADLILPTYYYSIADLHPDPEIEAAAAYLRQSRHIGDQYVWLPKFAKQLHLSGIEMGIISGDTLTTANNLRPYLDPTAPIPTFRPLEPRADNETEETYQLYHAHRVRATSHITSEQSEWYQLFHYFTFPIIHLSKVEMMEIAKQNGWFEFMELTWFCLKPLPGDKPCGQCSPCKIAKNEGMDWRFPQDHELQPVITTLENPIHQRIYNRMRRVFKVIIRKEQN